MEYKELKIYIDNELNRIYNKYIYQFNNRETLLSIERELDYFCFEYTGRYRLQFDILSHNDTLDIKPANLYTFIIMFGEDIPYNIPDPPKLSNRPVTWKGDKFSYTHRIDCSKNNYITVTPNIPEEFNDEN